MGVMGGQVLDLDTFVAGAMRMKGYASSQDVQAILYQLKELTVSADEIQQLVNETYDDITTRDRLRHSGSWMVPKDYEVKMVKRNENSKLWRKYTVKKAELQREKALTLQNPELAEGFPPY